jgi:cell division protein FtsB
VKRVKLGKRARVALAALALVTFLFVFVFPTRSFLQQRRQVSSAQHDLAVLKAQNKKLEAESQRLRSWPEVEALARQKFDLAQPGETLFKVLPAPASTTTTTP